MRAPRFTSALVVALCAHAAATLALAALRSAPLPAPITSTSVEELFVVSEEPSQPLAAPTTLAPEIARARDAAPRRSPRESASFVRVQPVIVDGAELHEAAPAPAGSGARSGATPIDLGIGTYWKSVALGGSTGSTASEEAREPASIPTPDRILREALDAHDRALGLGSEGPLVSAAHDAASPAIAPDVGTATFDVECDANGGGVTARVISVGADLAAWGDVARELVRLVSSKRLHVPSGAHGVRTRLRVVAERALPSGEKRETSPGAVPDDVPGSDPVCDGSGAERRCVAGSPVGVTQTIGDVANIGARRSRIVHVRVLSEVTL